MRDDILRSSGQEVVESFLHLLPFSLGVKMVCITKLNRSNHAQSRPTNQPLHHCNPPQPYIECIIECTLGTAVQLSLPHSQCLLSQQI